MGTTTVTIKSYKFTPPKLLTESEFNSYKQIYKIDPSHSITPNSEFWKEFAIVKWSFFASIVSLPLGLIAEALSVIFVLSFIVFFFGLLGNVNSMINYSTMDAKRRSIFNKLEHIIKTSESYEEFKVKFKELNK